MKTMIRLTKPLAAIACLYGSMAWAQPAGGPGLQLTEAQREWLAAHPRITLGPYRNYAPAQFVDEQGVHRGIAADYVARIEELLSVEFVNIDTNTWQEILDKARAREIDVIALAAQTPDRAAYLTFTSSYLDLPAVLIARDSVRKQLSPADLEGMQVTVVQGYAVHDFLKDNYPNLLLDPVADTRTALRKVSLGMADVLVSDLAVASHYIEQEGISNLHVVGDSGFVYHMGFASRSDWPQLNTLLEQALGAITKAERTAIYNRWISLAHEPQFTSRTTLNVLLGTVTVIGLLAIGVLVWNASLQRRVTRRTRQLDVELTERKRAVQALKESEERIRRIIGTALDAVITMDARGLVTGWSTQAQSTFGWSRDEAIDRPLAELIIPAQYREAHEKGLRHFLASGTGPVLNTRIEINGLHKDGHEIPVELAISPLQRGSTFEFCAFVRDITERKQAEAQLKKHRDELEEQVVERTAGMRQAKEAAERAEADLAVRVNELEAALAEVNQLRGLLPICSYCKRIREGEAYTRSVEAYFAEHHDTQFSHGVCPECYEKHVRPQLEKL